MRQLVEEQLLPRVTKPIRYQGNEWNSIHKDWSEIKVRLAFAFPDLYEVGMSHLGLHILYGLVNKEKDFLMERVFAPWGDMEELMGQNNVPLFSLESYHPVKDFDLLGFTLQYEMSFTNILNMLNLAEMPLLAKDRDDSFPVVIGGGPCAYNPEPLAPFFDIFVLGDAEELLLEILNLAKEMKKQYGDRLPKEKFLQQVSKLQGIYVPSFYKVIYSEEGKIESIEPVNENVPAKVQKRVVKNLDEAYFPTKPIVPFADTVHNRVMVEVARGCTRSCRFCQAGIVYRPVRERSQETLLQQAKELVKNTGHDEIALTSLNTADYSCVEPLTTALLDSLQEDKVGISLPSLRVDAFSVNLAKKIQEVRKSGLTFAPEAGTQRLRDVINKGVTEEDLITAVSGAFAAGWTHIKLYFMIGLPTETKEDIAGIADLAYRVLNKGRQILTGQNIKKPPRVTVSVSSFVPKSHTPFQWVPQDPIAVLQEKQQYLKSLLKDRRITYNYHDAKLSLLEAVFAKGDRRLGEVLQLAWQKGCKFDSWSEYFKYNTWLKAFEEIGLDPEFYAYRKIELTEMLPWEHLETGVSKNYLRKEFEKAVQGELTKDCRFSSCGACGICSSLKVKPVFQREAKSQ
ncbi:TIGR03960 family B12-binding radical SAM protein [Bacillota bacterium LX-D]|nr:TIGR03960 family B12-binding radical SAM protein [Bacillota bacterium LX-D]